MRDGLKQRCITRDLKWGVPVPMPALANKARFYDYIIFNSIIESIFLLCAGAWIDRKVLHALFAAPIGYIVKEKKSTTPGDVRVVRRAHRLHLHHRGLHARVGALVARAQGRGGAGAIHGQGAAEKKVEI